MGEWLALAPGDLLLFSEDAYWRLFQRANAAAGPLALLAPAMGAAAAAAGVAAAWGRRATMLWLAFAWTGVAALFLPLYREINWALDHVAPLFWAEAALLALGALLGPRALRPASGPRRMAGLAVAAAAILLWPLLAILAGRPFSGAEVAGLAPDPTALATLGLLAAFGRGPWAAAAALPPALWCAGSVAVLLTMGTWEGWALLAASIAAVAAIAFPSEPAK